MSRIADFAWAGVFVLGFLAVDVRAQNLPAGVGINIQFNDADQCVITQLAPGGPAERAGIKSGEVIAAIDGRGMDDIDEDEIPGLIRGKEGTEVVLTIRSRDGETRKVSIKREIIGAKAAAPAVAPVRKEKDAKPQAAGDGTMKFTRLSVNDPGINNIEAISLLIPAGWKAEGGVQWFPDYSVLANLLMKITDPTTGAQIEYLPVQNFTFLSNPVMPMQQGQNYMGNIVWQPIDDLHELVQTFYVKQVTPQLKDAKPLGQDELPKIEQIVAQQWGGGSKVKSGRVRYEYERDGKLWLEDVYITAVYTPNELDVFWSVTSAYAFRAPKDELDRLAPVMSTTVNTAKLNPDWYSGYMYVQKLFADRMNQGIKNAAAISATITRNSEEIRQMYSESYKQRQESQDRISESFPEYIRGVDTYKNPYEDRPVQLPSGYNDAWVNGKGEYILSNQSGFDPNVGDTTEWRRMDRRGENK